MPEVLPELGALGAVAALLIIAAALWVLQGLIRNSFGRLPVVGGWINRNIDAALNDARNAVLRGAGATWGVARQLFRWMIAFARNPVGETLRAFTEVYSFARRLYDVTLPALETRVLLTASQWFGRAESYALGLYRKAEADATALEVRALATASGWVTAAEHETARLFDAATAGIARALTTAEADAANLVAESSTALAGDIRAAEQWAAAQITSLDRATQAAVNALAGDITAGIATAETVAAARLAAVQAGIYTDLETWGIRAVQDAWPDAEGDVRALRDALGGDFPWLNDLLGALGGLGAAGLLGALIRSLAGAHAVTRLAADCIVPECRNLGGLSHDLGNLLGTASTAAMLAWLIFAVTDPSGWAAETAGAAGGVARTVTADAARLFGGG